MQSLNTLIGAGVFLAVLYATLGMPGKKAFIVIFLTFLTYMAWNFYDLFTSRISGDHEGMGRAMAGLLLSTLLSIGLLGMLLKVLWRWLAYKNVSRKIRMILTFSILSAVGVGVFLYLQYA